MGFGGRGWADGVVRDSYSGETPGDTSYVPLDALCWANFSYIFKSLFCMVSITYFYLLLIIGCCDWIWLGP